MDREAFILMTVGGLTLDPMTKTPIVVLKDESDEITLPIWIGLLEAASVATQLEGVAMARPMTHDLLKRLVEEVGARVERIEVTALKENTFYAAIKLDINGNETSIDSRPSDAISLALRTKSPIYVAKEVIEASAASANDVQESQDEETASETQDISDVSPDEWADILESLDPDDFKYKM